MRPTSLAAEVSFNEEVRALTDCRLACVHRLVADLEASVMPQLTAMTRMPWSSLTSVGDQSPYVTAIVTHLKSQVPLIRDTLFSVRKVFTRKCPCMLNFFELIAIAIIPMRSKFSFHLDGIHYLKC